jgi:hypothetical protein
MLSFTIVTSNVLTRGIQIILNSTAWDRDTHSGAYDEMKVLSVEE